MTNKINVALLLVVCLVVAAGVEAMDMEHLTHECHDQCEHACVWPKKSWCKWWCDGRCKNPALLSIQSSDEDEGARDATFDQMKQITRERKT
ncbi:hypothetical protein RJT34_25162 [Clitoria ternatea]|uniref:Uncharacterized protein n=1 Tax=Clitoria ternatea TaxID=43366 RepID=A0AAN9FPJ5_CLITE